MEQHGITNASSTKIAQVNTVFALMQRLNITGVPVTLRRFKNEANATQTTLHVATCDCMKLDEAEEYDGSMMKAR